MPYIACPACGLPTYTAAAWAGTDQCPACAAELPSKSGRVLSVGSLTSESRMAQIESARAALQRLRRRAGGG
jgi:uncharacterized Zn finger protein (UPF0148 family)